MSALRIRTTDLSSAQFQQLIEQLPPPTWTRFNDVKRKVFSWRR